MFVKHIDPLCTALLVEANKDRMCEAQRGQGVCPAPHSFVGAPPGLSHSGDSPTPVELSTSVRGIRWELLAEMRPQVGPGSSCRLQVGRAFHFFI